MSPCLVERDDFLPADAMPHLRSNTSPSSRSPLDSTRAFLHSIMPAPVRSRSCFTSAAVISAISLFFPPLVGQECILHLQGGPPGPHSGSARVPLDPPDFFQVSSSELAA